MGVRILAGKSDGHTEAAAMYDSASGWMIGPIFEGPETAEQVEAFRAWLSEHRWYRVRDEIFGPGADVALLRPGWPRGAGDDPREWSDVALGRLVTFWRGRYVGDDGWLLDSFQCACGHRHVADDGDGDGGCATCSCTRWQPGNIAAAERERDAPESVIIP